MWSSSLPELSRWKIVSAFSPLKTSVSGGKGEEEEEEDDDEKQAMREILNF